MSNELNEIKAWLVKFQECVQSVDYATARKMFDPDCYCFGSLAEKVFSLDELIEKQWSQIWPNCQGFQFNLDEIHMEICQEGDMACAMVPWTSIGFHPDGNPFERPGRVTILLKKNPSTKNWVALHTHYSLKPGTPQSTKKPTAGFAAHKK